jgi:hypothetical protein
MFFKDGFNSFDDIMEEEFEFFEGDPEASDIMEGDPEALDIIEDNTNSNYLGKL